MDKLMHMSKLSRYKLVVCEVSFAYKHGAKLPIPV